MSTACDILLAMGVPPDGSAELRVEASTATEAARGFTPDRRLVLGAIAALVLGTQLGRAAMAPLLGSWPLLLLVLSPIPVHLVLVAPLSDPVAFVAVVSARRLVGALLGYYLGVHYGDAAVHWVEARSGGSGRALRWLKRSFGRFPYPMIVLLPNLGTPLLAGAVRLRMPAFIATNLVGQAWIAAAFYMAGDAMRELLLPVIDFIGANMIAITALSIALVVMLQVLRRRRRKRRGPREAGRFDDLSG